jgi:hypothetical protein
VKTIHPSFSVGYADARAGADRLPAAVQNHSQAESQREYREGYTAGNWLTVKLGGQPISARPWDLAEQAK